MLDASHVKRISAAAIDRAREFFNLTPEWKIHLQIQENDIEAEIFIKPHYHIAHLRVNPGKYDNPAAVWADVGHEVAHLVTADFELLYDYARTLGNVNQDYLSELWKDSVEPVVMRLEDLFVRHNPMPRSLLK